MILLRLNGLVSGEPQAPMEVTGAPRFNRVALSGLELAPVICVQHTERLSFKDWQLWLRFYNGTVNPIISIIALVFWVRRSIV